MCLDLNLSFLDRRPSTGPLGHGAPTEKETFSNGFDMN